MSFEKIYSLLEAKTGYRFLIFGEALPLALYIGGRGIQEKKILSMDVLVQGTAKYRDEEMAMIAFHEFSETMDLGVSRCSVSHGDILAYHGVKVNGVVYASDMIEPEDLEKLAQLIMPGGKIILSISKQFFDPVMVEEKSLFKKTVTMTSFRRLLMASGFSINYYDIESERLLCRLTVNKFDKKPLGLQLPILSHEDAAKRILDNIKPLIKATAGGSNYAIRENEYIYLVSVADVQGPNQYRVVFLSGETMIEESSAGKGKHFDIYILPNVATFIKELELRDVLIVGKERVLELFGEHYVPS